MSLTYQLGFQDNKADDNLRHQRAVVIDRLREKGIETERLVPLSDGAKNPIEEGWSTGNQYDISTLPEGNYGIVAGDGLLILDIDDYGGELPAAIAEWIDDHPSLTVRSPHGGTHRYYAVPENTSEHFERDLGVRNPDVGALEVYTDGSQSVGPGSELDSCRKDWHDCSADGEGRYRIDVDRELCELSERDVRELIERVTDKREAEPTGSDRGSNAENTLPDDYGDGLRPNFGDLGDSGIQFHVVSRIRQAKTDQEHAERFRALWEGRYTDAGYDDRSQAEQELLCRLAFWLDRNREAMRLAMNQACRENPTTGAGAVRKWVERPGDYRERSITEALETTDETYTVSEGPAHLPFDERPDVSYVTSNSVIEALFELELASTTDLHEHPATDRSKRQLRRALSELRDDGMVERTSIGRRTYHYLQPADGQEPGATISDQRLDELDVDPAEL